MELATLVMELETSLLLPSTRADAAKLSRLLADDFLEIGSSGQIYNKAEIIAALGSEAPMPPADLSEFSLQLLSSDVALVTYRTSRTEAATTTQARRSSIWVFRAGVWQIRFHQGTRIP